MTVGTHRSRRRASCACAVTRFACAPGARPVRNSVTSKRRDERADRGARQEPRRAREVQRARVARDVGEPTAARDRDELRAPLDRARRHRHGLFGVARVRHRDRERLGTDERGRADLLQHRDRNRELVVERGRDDVARDPRTAHAEHDDVADRVAARERVGVNLARDLVRVRRAVRAAPRPRRGSSSESVGHCSNVGLMPSLSAFFVSRACSGVVDGLGVVDEQIGDVAVEHAVPPVQSRVVQRLFVGEVQERALVLRAREDLEQFRVERHGAQTSGDARRSLGRGQHAGQPRMSASTSRVCASHCAASGASRFKRSNGSVLLGRRLNHHSPQSTVSPSSRSCGYGGELGRDRLDDRRRDRRPGS